MHLEAVRLQADWLAGVLKDAGDVDRGVNAMLPGVPRDAGDPAPPSILVVEDETRHPSVARHGVPSQLPGLAVRLYRELEQEPVPATVVVDADAIELVTDYVVREVDTEEGLRNGLYTGRAIVRSLRAFALNANAAKRQRNSIALVQLMGIRLVPAFVPIEDSLVTASVVTRWKGRDLAPQG